MRKFTYKHKKTGKVVYTNKPKPELSKAGYTLVMGVNDTQIKNSNRIVRRK